jgi:hypothetical protein
MKRCDDGMSERRAAWSLAVRAAMKHRVCQSVQTWEESVVIAQEIFAHAVQRPRVRAERVRKRWRSMVDVPERVRD